LPEWEVARSPTVSIGGSDLRPDYLLDGVVGATRLSDGRIVVASLIGSDIKYFSPTGERLRTVGRQGRGPGEYEAIHVVFKLPGDTLMVVSRLPGLTWLSPEGDYVRSLAVNLAGRERHPCRMSEGPIHSLGDGRLLTGFGPGGIPGCAAVPNEVHRATTLIEMQDYPHDRFDTVTVMPGTERDGFDYRVFGAQALIAAGGGRVFAADSRASEVQVFEGTRHIAAWMTPLRAVPVPRAATRERFERRQYSDGRVATVEFDYPDYYPVIGRLLADAVGALWVMRYPRSSQPLYSVFLTHASAGFLVEDGGAHWIVHDRSGTAVARVHTPDRFFPIEIGADYILGVSKDELDVQTVELYSFIRR
jgi:hypothetical protein